MKLETSLLLTDFYALSMLEVYAAYGMNGTAVFELFVRKLPEERGFLMAAGLEQVVTFLETLRFEPDEIEWLRSLNQFRADFLDGLAGLRFVGDVDAMPEGTIFFADEPILRVTAPLPVAQLVEARLINLVQFQTLVASKAARVVLAAPGKRLIDFGFRRAHGAEAGFLAARASYLAGFHGTATVDAGHAFGIPIMGTMAHSFIEAHDDEETAFERFASVRPQSLTLLIDTYDTERGAALVAKLAPRLAAKGVAVQSVRIDSGDLVAHAKRVRDILDAAGQRQIAIFASGGLDERSIQKLCREAPIDGFGVGTSLTTSSDAPTLDCAYKLQEYAGRPRRKKSEGKATWPGRKQVYRRYAADGTIAGDCIALVSESGEGEPLLTPVIRAGRRVAEYPSLDHARRHAATSLKQLPASLRELRMASVAVEVSAAVRQMAAELDAEIIRNAHEG
jgi:nicotinate phosphoribosyltransferase